MSGKVAGNLNVRTVKKRHTAFYDFQVYSYLKYMVVREPVSVDAF